MESSQNQKDHKNKIIFGAGTEDPRNIIHIGDLLIELPAGVQSWGSTKKTFRVDAKRFFITYPQCFLSKEELQSSILSIIEEKYIQSIEIAQELHKDGNPHLHMILILKYKYNCRNCRWLDIGNYHPNIGGVKNLNACRNYIKKFDTKILTWGNDDPFEGPEGFCRKKADLDAWNEFQEKKRLKIWEGPIICFGIEGIPGSKKRHIWIIGDPDLGKSEWIENTFEGYHIYKPQKDSDYRFDTYDGEKIIIYDDIIPKLAELIDVSNIYKTKTPVFGKTRYSTKYWPIKQERMIIIVSNIPPLYFDNPAFQSRFILQDLRRNKE